MPHLLLSQKVEEGAALCRVEPQHLYQIGIQGVDLRGFLDPDLGPQIRVRALLAHFRAVGVELRARPHDPYVLG